MKGRFDWLRRSKLVICAGFLSLLLTAGQAAHAQLRIISYNTTTADPEGGFTTPRADTDIVLQSIGEELKNGIAKPIDVLLLQEQYTMDITTEAFVVLLNGIYGAGTYARGDLDGLTSDSLARGGRPGIVYNTETVQLLEEVRFGTVNGSNQARSTMRYKLRPLGYDNAVFYAYNNHYKAGSTPTDESRRQIEANSIRTNATYGSNALGEGAHAIYAGDHNLYTSSEPAFQTLIAAGAGQANDPINRVGSWSNTSSFSDVHTQSPCLSSCIGSTGGMDDRFDFQLTTGEMLDGEGLSVISGSYHSFGNNGTTYNNNINAASNTYSFPAGMTYTKSQILNALRVASDHIPVVADYQLPAWLNAVAGSVPAYLEVGQAFNLGVTVNNAAPTTLAIGADELDYSVTTSGSVSGSFLNQMDAAAGGSNVHMVNLDTSTVGLKSGTILVTSSSQGVQNGSPPAIPISYQVILPGDYNGNNVVDAADYVSWRNGGTLLNDATPGVQPGDYDVWRSHFGQTASGAGSGSLAAAVPEPSTLALLAIGVCWIGRRARRLRG